MQCRTPAQSDGSGPEAREAASPQRPGSARLALADRIALPIAILVLLVLTVPRLPPGICFGDPGDLQVTAATLGIAHPPGYAGYVSLGYLLTLIPGLSPAYAVSLGCLAAGLAALTLCALLQMRLGVNAWIAAALVVALAAHPRFWPNLVLPEVYAPSLAFEVGAAYLLLSYARRSRLRDLLIAALLLGIALANRPPLVLALPGFVVALGIIWRRRTAARRLLRNALLFVACLVAPLVYSAAYLWVRDTPATPCNYIEGWNREFGGLPPADAGMRAKAERLVWISSGQQFRGLLRGARVNLLQRLAWVSEEIGLKHDVAFVIATVVIAWGLVLTARRSASGVALLAGIGLATAVFVGVYRVYDTAADVLPLLFVLAVLGGVTLSLVFPARIGWPRRAPAIAIFIGVWLSTALGVFGREALVERADATTFVRTADLETLPPNSVVFSAWRKSRPLLYGQHVCAARDDIEIITASPSRWVELARQRRQQPDRIPGVVYVAGRVAVPKGITLTPFRNLWRVEFVSKGMD